jgi:YD repeat-containing protein
VGSASSTYAYSATSNRLSQITGSNPRSYTHDPVGSITADGANTFVFDTRGRMAQSLGVLGTTDYKVNSLGQRIRKTGAQDDTIYHYDSQGRLIAESSAAGVTQKEYVYLGDIPVAIVVGP